MIWATVRGGPVLLFDGIFKYRAHWWRKTENRGFQNWVLAEDAFLSLKKKCGFGNVFSHTEMRPLLFCVSDTPKTALIYLKNGPNCCVRFNFGGRYKYIIKNKQNQCKIWFHRRLLLLSQPASPALRLLLLKKFGSKSLNYHWNISKNCIWDNMGVEGPR